jgi:hypothetical protein
VPRLKVPDEELDIDALEEAEYDDRDFDYESYDGELPPADTHLNGYVKKAWWCYTSNEDPMIKLLFIADGNVGDEEEYNGLPVWEQLPLTNSAKFKWKPFIDVFEISLFEIKKKTMIAEDPDNIGDPITRIGSWEPGEDARCSIVTKRGKFQGKDKVEVRRWLDEQPADEDDEEELEDYEEEEEEEEPEPPTTRRARSSAKPAPAKAAPAKPAARPAKPVATGKPAARRTAASAKPAAKPTASRTRGRRVSAQAGYDDEPPF